MSIVLTSRVVWVRAREERKIARHENLFMRIKNCLDDMRSSTYAYEDVTNRRMIISRSATATKGSAGGDRKAAMNEDE